jgi:uncharacterized membrane protein YeaQ/YmgE (transglycosylase-associated protein family)
MTLGDFFVLMFVGLIAGWLAGVVMKGGGYGLFGDILLGIVGAVVGGLLFGMLGLSAYGFIGRVVVAFVGSLVLVGLTRVLRGRPMEAKRW